MCVACNPIICSWLHHYFPDALSSSHYRLYQEHAAFGCCLSLLCFAGPCDSPNDQVAGGASIITSRAMTQELSPHLEPWYRGIVERSGGDVNKAAEEDKFHDIAFQK